MQDWTEHLHNSQNLGAVWVPPVEDGGERAVLCASECPSVVGRDRLLTATWLAPNAALRGGAPLRSGLTTRFCFSDGLELARLLCGGKKVGVVVSVGGGRLE